MSFNILATVFEGFYLLIPCLMLTAATSVHTTENLYLEATHCRVYCSKTDIKERKEDMRLNLQYVALGLKLQLSHEWSLRVTDSFVQRSASSTGGPTNTTLTGLCLCL